MCGWVCAFHSRDMNAQAAAGFYIITDRYTAVAAAAAAAAAEAVATASYLSTNCCCCRDCNVNRGLHK